MQLREFNYLQDMLNAAKLAQDFVAGIDWAAFEIDLMRQAAVTREFEIIGEAARRISTETQLTSCSRTKERLAERVKKVEKGVEVKKQQNNGNHSYTSPDPSLYIARFDADLLSTR